MFILEGKLYLNDNKSVLIDLVNYRIFQLTPDLAISLEEFEATGNVQCNSHAVIIENLINELNGEKKQRKFSGLKIHVSNTCNLRCKYCYAHQGNYGDIEAIMNEDITEQVIDFTERLIKEQKLSTISFFGGEPFMGITAIETICEKLQKYNIDYLLQTNGTIFNTKIFDLITKYNIRLTVSLDGKQEINDANRIYENGKGTYDDIINNIQKINMGANKYVNGIQATISKEFADSVQKKEISDYIYKKTKIPFIKVEYDIDMDKTYTHNYIEKEIDEFFEAFWKDNYIMMGETYNIFCYFVGNMFNNWNCSAGIEFFTITSKGDIYPCQMMIKDKDKAKLGSIDDNLSNIHNKRETILKNINNVTKSSQLACRECVALNFCQKCLIKTENEFCDVMKFRLTYFLSKLSEFAEKGLIIELVKKYNLLCEF